MNHFTVIVTVDCCDNAMKGEAMSNAILLACDCNVPYYLPCETKKAAVAHLLSTLLVLHV